MFLYAEYATRGYPPLNPIKFIRYKAVATAMVADFLEGAAGNV